MSTGVDGNKAASDFLLSIYTTCGAEYKNEQTNCTTAQLLAALDSYNYSYEYVAFDRITRQNLFDKSPAIILSYLQGQLAGGHAWIVEGARHGESHSEVEVWTFNYQNEFECIYNEQSNNVSSDLYYVNWGWSPRDGKMYNGYYELSHMYPNGICTGNIFSNAIFNLKPKK